MAWKMFLIEPTNFCRRTLRRFYNSSEKGPVTGEHFHDGDVIIDDQFDAGAGGHGRATLGEEYRSDPRWPKSCRCGYAFDDRDHWQMNETRLWKGSPDGKLYPLRETPPGATWAADWYPEEGPNGQFSGPDGKAWCVMLPAGMEWIIYGFASGNPKSKWDVQGVPPQITVNPSILQTGFYHGFIRGGVITDDCDGRKFPQWPATA
jgi:hypothetical protein